MFFVAEFATAVAGWVLQINPFDQPNVQEAKDATKRGLAGEAGPSPADAGDAELRALLADPPDGSYLAVMGYLTPSLEELDEAVRETARRRSWSEHAVPPCDVPGTAHALPALHRAAPQGRQSRRSLLVLDRRQHRGRPDPARLLLVSWTLKQAQALGDLETLRGHGGLPAEIVHLHGDPAEAVRALHTRLKEII